MRLLHTSDWHLGRTLHGVDLIDHQQVVLANIVDLARAHAVDLIVVAGDVYDRGLPNVEAVQLLDRTLPQLLDIAPVLLIPGNHDSAARLGFASGLLRGGLHIVASLDGLTRPLVLTDEFGDVAIYGLPFLDPDLFRYALAESDEPLPRTHEAVVAAAMQRVRDDLATRPGARAVVVAHAFVTGGTASSSERDLRVGGIETVPTQAFAGMHYVALGHLHGPQEPASPDGMTRLRYSGSPLRYSFSETDQSKSVTIVELDASGVASIEVAEIPQPRAMAQLTGELSELLQNSAHVDDWVSAVVTDQKYPEDLYAKLRVHFPYLLEVQHRPPVAAGGVDAGASTLDRDPLDLMREFVLHVTGAPVSDAEQRLLADVYESAQAAERSE